MRARGRVLARSMLTLTVITSLVAACGGSAAPNAAPSTAPSASQAPADTPSASAVGEPNSPAITAPAFAAGQSIEIVPDPANVTAADFNGDGMLDLAAGSESTDQVAVLIGNGDGTFGPPAIIHAAASDYLIATDMNGDSKQDIVVAGDALVFVLMGKGDGTFAPMEAHGIVGSLSFGEAFWVDATDLNSDGSRDLLVSVYGDNGPNPGAPGQLAVLLGSGDGTLSDPAYYEDRAAVAVAAGDFDYDGQVDVATANFDGTLRVFRGSGTGALKEPTEFQIHGQGVALVAADFDGDRYTDLLVGNDASHSISVLVSDGGSFATADVRPAANTHSVQVADLDGDGDLDLLAGGYDDPTVRFWPGAGDGTFADAPSIPLGDVLDRAFDVGDFNGDGKLDLVVNDGKSALHVFLAD